MKIVVVGLSEAFEGLWSELASSVGAGVSAVQPGDTWSASSSAAVIVAAGGAEGEAVGWLESAPLTPDCPCYVVGVETDHRTAAKLVAAGASDYFALPPDLEILRNTVTKAIDLFVSRRQRHERDAHVPKAEAFESIIGESPAIKAALSRAARVMEHGDATVLITGETGTGKELVSEALHRGGPRRGAPFVEVNCTALPAHLLESELFGHEKGAFTDAHATKPGLFEVADGGTIFLDEIGHLPLEMQAKLLRVLEDRQVRRVGGLSSRRIDVRIIAATNADLPAAVRRGEFREDLFFRLNVIMITLPPLRERGADVILIAQQVLKRLAAQYGLPTPTMSAEVRRMLRAYHWPGNVRELRNAVERALLLSPPGELELGELLHNQTPQPSAFAGPIPFPASLADITTAAAAAMLEECSGNQSEAARRLQISRARLARLLKRGEAVA